MADGAQSSHWRAGASCPRQACGPRAWRGWESSSFVASPRWSSALLGIAQLHPIQVSEGECRRGVPAVSRTHGPTQGCIAAANGSDPRVRSRVAAANGSDRSPCGTSCVGPGCPMKLVPPRRNQTRSTWGFKRFGSAQEELNRPDIGVQTRWFRRVLAARPLRALVSKTEPRSGRSFDHFSL